MDGDGRMSVLVNEVRKKFVELRLITDRVMYIAMVFKDVVRVVSMYSPQSGKLAEVQVTETLEMFCRRYF